MGRLSDVVNETRRRVSEGTNFVRYPVQVVSQEVRKALQRIYEGATFPGGETKPIKTTNREPLEPENTEPENTTVAPREVGLSTHRRPASEARSLTPSLPDRSLIDSPLSPGTVLKSLRNHYTIGTCIEDDRTRLYQATTRSDEPVLIKEYFLLEHDLNPAEIEVRQKAFERLIELNLKIGNGPDFRVVKLVDAIAPTKERCCYLVTKPINHNTTLEAYLTKHGAMPAKQIREVLRQVLETLRYLHTAYRVHFPSGDSERGLPHGNLSLKSLLIRHVDGITSDRQFFIYISDLELWEHLFHPRISSRFHSKAVNNARDLGSEKQDLIALGLVGFLLAGDPLNSGLDQPWQALNDEPLRGFLQNLQEPEPRFRTAEQALHALIQLEQPQMTIAEQALLEATETHPAQNGRLALILGLLALGFFGLVSWFVGRTLLGTPQLPAPMAKASSPVTRISAVKNVPSIIYWVEPKGTWDFALQRTFISSNAGSSRQTLTMALRDRCIDRCKGLNLIPKTYPNLQFNRQDESRKFLFNQLLLGKAQVGLARLSDDIPKGLGAEAVAYDALTVIVPFVDPYRAQNTVGALGRSITLEELRQLYTAPEEQIDHLKLHGHKVKLFFPETQETIELFEALVLQSNPDQIRKFWRLKQIAEERDWKFIKEKRAKHIDINYNIYEVMLSNFESSDDKAIGIGFDRLSRTFNQCSVYPLAIQQGTQAVPILVQSNGAPIDENIDLCGAKGSYFPNVQNYPLKYKLGVVFAQENANAGQKLAEILTTTEGQYLMSQVGLVPEQPMQELLDAIEGERR